MFIDEFENINFLVGVNGSGKSRYLNVIAKKYKNYNYNVLAISNTVFDKIDSKYCKKISANRGRYYLKKVLLESLIDDEKSIGAFNILKYLEFKGVVEISFKFPKGIKNNKLYNYFIDKLEVHKIESPIDVSRKVEEIENIINIFLDQTIYDDKYGYLFKLDDFEARNKTKYNYYLKEILNFIYFNKLANVDVVLSKDEDQFFLNGASSGESHFISNMLFLHSNLNMNKKNIILIDEPEISLHPKWQREYVLKLYDYFYKYDIQVFIATHSPLMISKVQSSRNELYQDYVDKVHYKIFKVKNENLKLIIEDEDYSIESLYWEVFGILTPDNSFLSRYCVDLLDRYDLGQLSYLNIRSEFKKLKDACDLELQKKVLSDIENRFVVQNEH